jgi:hypothetical protein
MAFILYNIYRAHNRSDLFIRRIPGLNAINDAVGRATEMGKPVVMVPGLSGLDAISVQALSIYTHVCRLAARFSTPIVLCVTDPAVYTVAQEMIRDVYLQEGLEDRYDIDSVRFISDRQFAFAAGVSGIVMRDQAAACFFMGAFFAEALIFAETANSVGAIQVASSTETTQTPFFITACDYVLIGDEFYAASAYLSREPVFVGSLLGQDWSKIAILIAIVVGVVMNTAEMGAFHLNRVAQEKVNAKYQPVTPAPLTPQEMAENALLLRTNPNYRPTPSRPITLADTTMSHLFHPQDSKDWKVVRPQKPPTPAPAGGGE